MPETGQGAASSREALLGVLREGGPATLATLSERTGMPVNTLRDHLARLAETGLVASTTAPPSGRGRPPRLFRATAVGLDGRGDVPASRADVPTSRGDGTVRPGARVGGSGGVGGSSDAGSSGAGSTGAGRARGDAVDEGGADEGDRMRAALTDLILRRYGRSDASLAEATLEDGELLARELGAAAPASDTDQVGALMDVFTRLGFAPTHTSAEGGVETISLWECPVRELAAQHPEVVCRIHLGLARALGRDSGGGLLAESLTPGTGGAPCALVLRGTDAAPQRHEQQRHAPES